MHRLRRWAKGYLNAQRDRWLISVLKTFICYVLGAASAAIRSQVQSVQAGNEELLGIKKRQDYRQYFISQRSIDLAARRRQSGS